MKLSLIQGIILVYDVTAEYSFSSINNWLETIEQVSTFITCNTLMGKRNIEESLVDQKKLIQPRKTNHPLSTKILYHFYVPIIIITFIVFLRMHHPMSVVCWLEIKTIVILSIEWLKKKPEERYIVYI